MINGSMPEAEASRGRQAAWSTEQVSGQSGLGSERQKAGEDVINKGAMFQPQQVVLSLEIRREERI